MSGERQVDTTPSVDQRTRAEQTEDQQEEQVQTTDEAVEVLRRQVLELEARDRAREAEVEADRKRLAEERSRREAAEARATSVARDAENRVAHAEDIGRRTIDDARLGEITTSLTAHQGHMEALKTQYTAAFGEGDAAKMAEIQANMARMGARIETLEQAKSQIEARKTQQPPPQPIQPQAPGIDREALMRGLTSVERDWVLAHPRYFEDEGFRNEVTAAAAYALNRKHLSRESTEYINFLNEDLGLVQRQEPSPPPPASTNGSGRSVEGGAGASATATADRRMVAAPVGGSVPNVARASNSDDNQAVYLTKEEKAQAARDGISEADWAKAKRDLIREGAIGPNARNR